MSLKENSVQEKVRLKQQALSVTGLGYVGLQLAVEFGKYLDVIGYDINKRKVELLRQGVDTTNEVGNDALKKSDIKFTSDETELKNALFHIISVPTPVDENKLPDLTPVINASESVGRNLRRGAVVVYESTVYPGVTEEICVPVLEKYSGLECGKDFKVGYSPERISPGSKEHSLVNSVKIVSGMDEEALETISDIYGVIIEKQQLYRAESIKIAEAAKVVENTQRDVNIAFVNELSIILGKLGIDTRLVLKAASTKWNFMSLMPGLVGGHCIGVDPYYLEYISERTGYKPNLISSSRVINDNMGNYVGQAIINHLIKVDLKVKDSKVLVLGFTYKEDVPDIRNSRIVDIVKTLEQYQLKVFIADYMVDKSEVKKEYGLNISNEIDTSQKYDAIVLAVPHEKYKDLSLWDLKKLLKDKCVLIDVKGVYNKKEAEELGYTYWSL